MGRWDMNGLSFPYNLFVFFKDKKCVCFYVFILKIEKAAREERWGGRDAKVEGMKEEIWQRKALYQINILKHLLISNSGNFVV